MCWYFSPINRKSSQGILVNFTSFRPFRQSSDLHIALALLSDNDTTTQTLHFTWLFAFLFYQLISCFLYRENTAVADGAETISLVISNGMPQGYILSSLLLTSYINQIILPIKYVNIHFLQMIQFYLPLILLQSRHLLIYSLLLMLSSYHFLNKDFLCR